LLRYTTLFSRAEQLAVRPTASDICNPAVRKRMPKAASLAGKLDDSRT
jgi:hypothetical protein